MSWSLEEWKSELSSRALQKVSEYESQLEKLKKERQQKQLQLESLEVAFQKQNQKLEGERNENATLKREAQGLTEACNKLEKAQQRLCHEIQVKEALVCSLEGQLLAAKKQTDNLEQELKRLEAELERSQRAPTPAECQLHPTPTKIYPGCTTLSRASEGSKWDELQEKYNREVEEKKRLVSELKALKLQVQQLQFSSNKSHRESAPQQIRASTFSWQQEKTPTRVPESPVRQGSPSSVFPWEQPRTPPYHNSRSAQNNGNKTSHLVSESKSSQLNQLEESGSAQVQELRQENQVLQCTMSELEVWIQSQEKEIKNHLNRLQEVQSHLEKCKAELSTKEQALNKSRNDLMRATVQQEQTNNKCALLEQKLKQVSEELNCQRQNAESVRRLMEQKSKDKEKEHQQELSDQQCAYRNLEHQCKQEKNQLNQEIQKLKTELLALQSTIDKMATGKQLVDRELEEVKAKFLCAEKEFATHQRKGDDLQKSLQKALKEKDRISICQDQSTQRIVHLKTQLKRLEKQLTLSQKSREEIKTANLALVSKLKDLQQKLAHEVQLNSGSMGLGTVVCELNNSDRNKVGICELDEEQESHLSKDGQFDNAETLVGLQVKVREKILDLMEGSQLGELELRVKSVNLVQAVGANIEEDPILKTEVKVEAEQSGTSVEFQSSEETRDVFPDPEEKVGTRLQDFDKETKQEFTANRVQAAVMPSDPVDNGEVMIDWLDKPITVSAHLREREVELDEIKTKNQMLQRELDNMKQTLDAKVIESQKKQQTLAELRQKLKQAMQRCAAEAERFTALVTLQAGQLSALEKDLEHERVKVAKLQETSKMPELECNKVSQLTRSKDRHMGSNEDEIQILQNAASKKMQQLEQQIVDLNSEKCCIEEIIKTNDRKVLDDESRDRLLEYLKHEDVQNFELNDISLNHPNYLCCDLREMLEQKLNEEKTSFMEIVKGDNGSGHEKDCRELFLEYLKHKVVEQFEFNEQLLEHQKHLDELQKKCKELTREKEQEEKSKRQAEDKFDNLQSRIHRETQQLTVALEAQSKNIEGLLVGMEEKDWIIQVLNGRLQSTLKVLSYLQKENCELKTNFKDVVEMSEQKCVDSASPSRGTVLEQTFSGKFPQANQNEHENDGVLTMEKLGLSEQAPLINARVVPADEVVQKSDSGHNENTFDNSLLLSKEQAVNLILAQGDQFEEPKMALQISSAMQKLPELKEDPEKQAQQIRKINASCCENVFNMLTVPEDQRASSILSIGAPFGKTGVTLAVNSAQRNIIQLKQDVESLRQPEELNYKDVDATQHWQSIRYSDGLQMKISELEGELMVLHAEKPQSETLTKEETAEIADSKFVLLEEKSVEELRTKEELIEEVEKVKGRLNEASKVSEEEHRETKELNQKVVCSLNAELNSLNEKCTILEHEKEQLCLEVRRAQEAANDMQSEKEDLMNTIQSSKTQLRGSTEKQNHLKQELEVLQEWKQKVLEHIAALEAGKESGQVKRRALQESVLEMQNQMQGLEGECKTLQNAAENAKQSQKQLREELAQIQSEKSALQNQVDHLQKAAVELNAEKIKLLAKLKQWESRPADKEITRDVLQENGLCENLLSAGSQQQGTAQITASKLGADLEALKRTLQEKSEEVDRNLLNYSDLLNKHQELEAAKKILSKTVNHLHDHKALPAKSDQGKAAGWESQDLTEDRKPNAGQQTVEELAEAVEQDQIEMGQRSKGHTNPAEHSARLNPAELARKINTVELAARIQRNWQFRHHLSVAFDETEYEPYGLPDVVQKGFADIPSGPSCPHVLRRATLNSTLCPEKQGEGQSLLSFFKALGGSSKQ